MSKKISKGENDFIKGCTKAILENDTSLHHSLYLVGGERQYVVHKDENYAETHPIFINAKLLCVV